MHSAAASRRSRSNRRSDQALAMAPRLARATVGPGPATRPPGRRPNRRYRTSASGPGKPGGLGPPPVGAVDTWRVVHGVLCGAGMHSMYFQHKRAHLSCLARGREMFHPVAAMTPARFDILYLVYTRCRLKLVTALVGHRMPQ